MTLVDPRTAMGVGMASLVMGACAMRAAAEEAEHLQDRLRSVLKSPS